MGAQILFVAPFEDLAGLAEEVVSEKFGESATLIRVVKGDLQECIHTVKQAVADGVEVVVSRGGTADLIEKNVSVPIVRIQVMMTDVLRAIGQSAENYGEIGVVGFESMLYDCDALGKYLGLKLTELLIENEQDAAEKIAQAARDGIKLVVGDAVSTKIAREYGVRGELIHSGKEAILRALNEAALIAKIRREEQEKAELLQTVINQSPDGMIAVDPAGRITMMNPAAEKMFKVSHLEAVGRPIGDSIPLFFGVHADIGAGIADMEKIGGKMFTVKRSDIKVKEDVIGRIYAFQNVSQVQQLEQSIRKKLHAKGLVAKYQMEDIIGSSPPCMAMKRKALKYALTQSTILVTGESGTGKELLVQAIHRASLRGDGSFVAVNCAALPENLLESELFGYAEGAFTGAKKGGRHGLFELAHGGTIFLDEIGEMTLSLQARLLRVLQERAVMPLGGETVVPVDVRVIAATNRDLAKMVAEKTFRQDLYYRLNILRINMPTLAERADDIPLLAKQMVQKMRAVNPRVKDIDDEARQFLKQCRWPGNIRQLANIIERSMLLSDGAAVTQKDALEAYSEDGQQADEQPEERAGIKDKLDDVERNELRAVLAAENFNYTKAAKRLGIHRTTLWRKLNKKPLQ